MIKTIKPHHNKHTTNKVSCTIHTAVARLFQAYYPSTKSHAQRVVVLRLLGWCFWGGDRVAVVYVLYKILYKLLYDVVVPVFIYIWRPGISVACCTIIIQAVKNPLPKTPLLAVFIWTQKTISPKYEQQ